MPEHEASLKRFIEFFNKTEPLDIIMRKWSVETYKSDGVISYKNINIVFDWEKRDDWSVEDRCRFHYETLGQFERKFEPSKGIELTIQCDRNEKCFVVAWHSDFGPPHVISRKTNFGWKERGKMRETTKFKTYSYSEIKNFKFALKYALENNVKDYRMFSKGGTAL